MKFNAYAIDEKIITWLRKHFSAIARLAIFIVFFWFGALKLFGLSPAGPLAQSLVATTVGPAFFNELYIVLALLECFIGILFLFPKATRITIPLLLIHMATVSLPLALLPAMVWSQPFVPTLEGQYIIKNIVIVALALGIAAQLRPLRSKK